jgi:hypothetical protein
VIPHDAAGPFPPGGEALVEDLPYVFGSIKRGDIDPTTVLKEWSTLSTSSNCYLLSTVLV